MVRERAPVRAGKTSPVSLPATSARALKEAARVLSRGGVAAFPTETVYGLGVRYGDRAARERMRRLKGRDREKPFQVLLSSKVAALRICGTMPPLARKLASAFWPGGLTLVVRSRGGRWLGLRVPDHPAPRSLARRLGGALVATSANRSGNAPARTAAEALKALGSEIDLILDGGRAKLGAPSTVVRVEGNRWRLLRAGVISTRDIESVAGCSSERDEE